MLLRWTHKADAIAFVANHCRHSLRLQLRGFSSSSCHHAAPISSSQEGSVALQRTRNIGIIAHIDAGKTTTTERMLYYSGFTRRIGDVDEGSTVTDFLPAERARGITIQSAAISFSWPPAPPTQQPIDLQPGAPRSSVPHNINLIDTPGHADFTFEVLRSLRVLDGAVCILDGVAGVEAQTEKVWDQATAYSIPKIIFVNKLDRDGAAFGRTIREIGAQLGVWPAVCVIPWFTKDGQLQGVGDVVRLRALRYAKGGDGKDIAAFDLHQLAAEDQEFGAELKRARIALIELLSEHDDQMVEQYLDADEDHLAIAPEAITESLRKSVLHAPQHVVPVFAGASFRNVGVQPLLDAVVDLLPAPNERADPEVSVDQKRRGGLQAVLSGDLEVASATTTKLAKKDKSANKSLQSIEACALAFKVVADAKRGVLVYVRVYSGVLRRHQFALWNTNLQNFERVPRLLKMYANEAVDIEAIEAGQIGVIPGLKLARTGDTLVLFAGTAKNGPPRPFNTLQLKPIDVPPPVFFVSVEPNSLSEEKHIKECLDLLLREDPSLQVRVDEESGQTHLAGMGELHLEIARDRLINDLKAKARIGQIEIGYRETPIVPSGEVKQNLERDLGGKASQAACTASIRPRIIDVKPSLPGNVLSCVELGDNNRLTIISPNLQSDGSSNDEERPGLPENLPVEQVLQAINLGVSAALARGPVHRYALHSVDVTVELDPSAHIFPTTTTTAITSVTRQAVQEALRHSSQMSESVMMEPVMLVTISVDEESMGSVVHDISSARGGSVVALGAEEDHGDSDTRIIDTKKMYAPRDPFAGGHADQDALIMNANPMRQVVARVPLKEMVGYLKHLRSLTAGRGTFTMVVDRFEKMNGQRQKAVLAELRGGDFSY